MANKPKNPKKGMHGPWGQSTKEMNQIRKEAAKKYGAAQPKVSKSFDGLKTIGKSISAKKPSVASAALKGAKNKMKAQGPKTQSMGMQYSRGTRPKGK